MALHGTKTPWYDREYLRMMVKDATGRDFEDQYNVKNYVLLPRSQKNFWVSKQSPSLSINFVGSHLLNGKKYFLGMLMKTRYITSLPLMSFN